MSRTASSQTPSERTELSELNLVFEETVPIRNSNTPDINSVNLRTTSESEAAPQQNVPVTETDKDEAMYYIKTLGQVFGPMPIFLSGEDGCVRNPDFR
jgi:hypothetical protein